jgi:hypothetical protein
MENELNLVAEAVAAEPKKRKTNGYTVAGLSKICTNPAGNLAWQKHVATIKQGTVTYKTLRVGSVKKVGVGYQFTCVNGHKGKIYTEGEMRAAEGCAWYFIEVLKRNTNPYEEQKSGENAAVSDSSIETKTVPEVKVKKVKTPAPQVLQVA